MNCVLIVSNDEPQNEIFLSLCAKHEADILFITTIEEAKKTLASREFAVILINDTTDCSTVYDFALFCIASTTASVMLLASDGFSNSAQKQLMHCGVCVLKKPLHETMFCQAVQLLLTSRTRFLGLKQENPQLKKRIHTAHMIDRAKRLLMERLSFTEEQAYSYIKHHAMDMRVTKEQVASAVLTTYGGTDLKRKEE